MKIGIISSSLSDDIEHAIGLAAQTGAEGVELVLASTDQMERLQNEEYALHLHDLAHQHNLAICSLYLGFICRQPALIDAPDQAAKVKELVALACRSASRLEASVVLLPFFGNSAIELESELMQAIEVLDELEQAAEETNMTLGIESMLSIHQYRFLLNHFAHTPHVKVYFNTGNALARKLDVPTGLRDLGRQSIAGIHFKDVRLAESLPPDFEVQLGEGHVDFRAVAQALKAIQYNDWIVLELPVQDDPLAAATRNIQFVRSLLGAQETARR